MEPVMTAEDKHHGEGHIQWELRRDYGLKSSQLF